jgi:PAS domain S-box-containing protein
MQHLKVKWFFLLSVLAVGGVLFAVDIVTSQPYYVALVALGLWIRTNEAALKLWVVATVLLVAGSFFSNEHDDVKVRTIEFGDICLVGIIIHIRNKATRKLQIQEERFRLFAKMSPIGKFHTDAAGKIDFVNDKWLELTGVPYEKAIGAEWSLMLFDDESIYNEWQQKTKSGKLFAGEYVLRNKKTNHDYEALIKAVSIRTSDGELEGYVGTIDDITEQAKAKKIIEGSERWFRSIAENSPVMIWVNDSTFQCTYLNQTMLSFTGNTLKQELSRGWMAAIHPDDKLASYNRCRGAFEKREPFKIEYRLRRHDGQYRWITDHGNPVFLPDGTFTGYVGTCTDIHTMRTMNEWLEQKVKEKTGYLTKVVGELKHKIAEHQHTEENLMRANERFTKLFNESPAANAICLLENEELIDCNQAFAELTGYEREELIGGKSLYSYLMSDIRAGELSQLLKETDHVQKFEMELTRKQGDKVWVSLSLQRIMMDNKPYLLSVLLNTTELKRAEEKIISALKKEKELNEMKTNFLSVASHEFRTPLGVLLTSINLIEAYHKRGDNEKCNKYFRQAEGSIKNMTDILNDFLTLEKLEEHRVEHVEYNFDLTKFSTEIMEETKVILRLGQAIVYEHYGTSMVNLDKNTLRNILFNLISNASKYSPAGAKIYLTTEVQEAKIRILVRDTGIGIPQEDQKNIFTRFYRATNTNSIQGTGLGLNIVQKYVELMNGQITFISEVNRGTTFVLTFDEYVVAGRVGTVAHSDIVYD